MKILVTGGAGFIGSALVRMLITKTDARVVVLDKLTYAGNLHSIEAVLSSERLRFVQGDVCDAELLDALLGDKTLDAVIHLAAESHVDRSIDGPDAFVQTNLVGTYRLLDAARKHCCGLPNFRFIHVSTDEVFGDLGATGLFRENTPYDPSSPYSATKAGSDHLVRAWGRTYGLPIIVTNCSNNYGPFQFPEKLIPHMVLSALAGKRLPVYGDGSQIRDWLFVDDHVQALWTVLNTGVVGETYAIGGHNEQRNIDVVRRICELLDALVPKSSARTNRHEDLIEFVTDRPGHDTRYAIDASHIERTLGWKPSESFDSGMEKTVRWYVENRAWWQPVLDGSYRLGRIGGKLAHA